MTTSQIEYILEQRDLDMDTWQTLHKNFKYISMNSDKNIFYYPQSIQFYFSTNGYLLVRFTDGNPILDEGESNPPPGYVHIYVEGKRYKVKLEAGGIGDNSVQDAGIFHEIYAFEGISGIYAK